MTWDEEQERAAAEAIERQQLAPMTKEEQGTGSYTPGDFGICVADRLTAYAPGYGVSRAP